MIERLGDYAKQVIDDQDQVLVEESINAANAGVLRGAYILVWLSCAESLKRRFRAVRSHDATAARVSGEVERKEAAHNSIDQFLLKESKDYGFIDDAGFTRLNHIYEMRCVYGHPYERHPKEEDLVAAAAAVTELVLSQPVRLRHGYLTEQVRLLTQERAFLDDVSEPVAEYAKEVLGRMDDSLLEWFIEKLWITAEALVPDKSMAIFVRRVSWFCSELLAAAPATMREKWDVPTALTRSPVMGSSSMADERVFKHDTAHVQDIVVGNLVEHAKKDSRSLRHLQELADAGALNERQIIRFQEAVDSLPLKVMADVGIKLKYYAARIITDLKSHNWYTQNPSLEVLKNAGAASIGELDEAIQERLGNNVLQSAEGGAGSSRSFMGEIADSKSPWPGAFIRGIVAECFVNDENRIRFKSGKADDALRSLKVLPMSVRIEIVRVIVERLESGKPKEDYRLIRKKKEMLQIIEDAIKQDPEELKPLIELRNAVAAVELPKEDDE